MRKIALIGSTGSIGKQVLSVVNNNPDKFKIVSLAGGESSELLLEQVKKFNPLVATLKNEVCVSEFSKTQFSFGENAFIDAIIDEADVVIVALVGFKGILAVLNAIKKGKNIALANKESLVVGGHLVSELQQMTGVNIVPIDSEHSAVFQALNFDFNKPFKKIILTASGGAFRDLPLEKLDEVTVLDALNHPNWSMGKKITVDCATMVNKAFEVVEAHWLYNAPYDKIDVVMHRESIVHSMVEFCDNSVIAQMSYPSMELPIQLALTYPDRYESSLKSLDFSTLNTLTFGKMDKKRYPCFDLVLEGIKQGGAYPAVVNGANDMAVELFIKGIISYKDIYKCIDGAISSFNLNLGDDIDSLIKANDFAQNYVKQKFGV